MNTPTVPLDGEGDQTILFEICPEINKTVLKKKQKKNLLLFMESREIESRGTFSIETDNLFCSEAAGSSWSAPIGFPGLLGRKKHQFLHWQNFLFY